jgi:hypothetical protein
MWKFARGILLFGVCLLLAWLVWFLTRLVSPELSIPGATAPHITYAELIAVLLTGLAIAVGLLGIIVAGLALWGYREIRNEAKAIATRTARIETRKRVIEYLRSPEGSQIVEGEVARRFDELKEGLALAKSQPRSSTIETGEGSTGPKVGKPYSKERGPK